VNLMRFRKAKCKVLHPGWGKPCYQYRLGDEGMESSPAEKDLGELMDKKLSRNQQWPLAAQKSNCALGCIPSIVGTRQGGGGSDPLPCSGETPPGSPASSSGALSTGQTWSCWSRARGGPSNDARAGTPLLGGKAGRVGAGQPGEENAAGRP